MRRSFCAKVVCFLISIIVFPVMLAAQQGATPSFARAGNGVISVLVEPGSGQFRIEAANGAPLLFTGKEGVTAYSNLHALNTTWTTNTLQRSATPPGTVPFPAVQVTELPDRVRIESVVRKGNDSLRFVQELLPSLDGDYAYINIINTVENLTARPLPAGVLLMLDIMIGEEDTVDLTVDALRIDRERDWRNTSVPDRYEAQVQGSPFRIRGRLRSGTADIPDRFIAGNWQFNGYLGTVAWEYTPSGLPIIDDAVVLRWDRQSIPPGTSRTVRADYGYLTFFDTELFCAIDEIRYNADSTAYVPDPLALHATVRNTGVLPLPDIDVAVSLPPELTFAAGEGTIKTIPGPIPVGESRTLTWWTHTAPVADPTPIQAEFEIISPTELAVNCTADGVIPPLTKAMAELDCGDTIRLYPDPQAAGYIPDPFTISAILTNTGHVPIRNATATLALPPELDLVSPPFLQLVFPDPLLPGEFARVDWQVRALVQTADIAVRYSILVHADDGLQLSCENVVLLSALDRSPCIEPGVSTAGQEFYVAFLPDLIGAAQQYLRVFITAPEESTVRIRDLHAGSEQTVVVPEGAVKLVEVDRSLSRYPPEIPVARGVYIESDNPVHVFIAGYVDRHSDGSTVLPIHALGTSYVTVGYNWTDAYEHFVVLATEDMTEVTITPTAFTSSGRPDGQPITVSLARGEVYYIRAFVGGVGGSLTGSRIEANKPVAVFSGGESGWIPENNRDLYGFLNPHHHQMIPIRYLGNEYVAVPYRSRLNGDTWRIVATEDNTTVTRNGTVLPILAHAGAWMEDVMTDVTHFASDKPILVAQYANSAMWDAPENHHGDASMLVLVPTDRFMSCHYFPSGVLAPVFDVPGDADSNFVNIIVHDGGEQQVMLNYVPVDASEFTSLTGTSWQTARLRLPHGVNRLETADPRGLGAVSYGFTFHDAYTMFTGFRTSSGTSRVLPPALPVALSLEAPWPQPVKGDIALRFTLPQAGHADILLVDMLGRTKSVLLSGYVDAGTHRVNLPTHTLSSGRYQLILRSKDGTASQPLLILR
ncbi:MAG: IgGFc-binding protein [Bacteroidetes bacterium]|nr:IgGFc-binding protein [Bacteroidota bacterium]